MGIAMINEEYHNLYQQSITSPDVFWAKQAEELLTWIKPWRQTSAGSFKTADSSWFIEGQLNASFNCLDRHLSVSGDKIALIWEGNNPKNTKLLSYRTLYEEVCKFANVLKKHGVSKGDCVGIYLPMIPEVVIAMLACARIGAIHAVIFAGFSPESLQGRLKNADCKLLITADAGMRGKKLIPLKVNADKALRDWYVNKLIVVQHTGGYIPWMKPRDCWYHEEMAQVSNICQIVPVDSNDPLFILYTSGSTGKPKGIVHSTGGYLVYVAITYRYVFDYKAGDIHWCTADVGWITGHSYVIYGPLLNGSTTLLFEGVPYYPDFARYWQIIDKHNVNVFYTAPTALRTLRHEGNQWVQQSNRQSLKILGTVGEPINPEVWNWYYEVVGDKRCPIVDTWWQTETGGIMITPLPFITPLSPGAAAWPFFGIIPEIVDDDGHVVADGTPGLLVIKKPWPGIMQTIYKNHARFEADYFEKFPGYYFTGDGAYRDSAGYFTITGRVDDIIKVSGHRISTAEIENALLTHPDVSEAAVIGVPDEISGECICAFIVTKLNVTASDPLKQPLIQHVGSKISHIAKPKIIYMVKDLPKTRSGKVMRRILRILARKDNGDVGDLSTLAESHVVRQLQDEIKVQS